MIFVTVGSTLRFDELIQMLDSLVAEGQISESVICQIGNGTYIPKNCEYFNYQLNIDYLIEKASLVICHGGTGTVCSLIAMKKTFIAVANSRAADDHQTQFLSQLSKYLPLLWTNELDELPGLIKKAAMFRPQSINAEHLADDLKRYFTGL